MRSMAGVVLMVAVIGTACSGSDGANEGSTVTPPSDAAVATDTDAAGEQRFPDVIDASAELTNLGWAFDVTVSSPYDSADRYADAWRVVGPDGTVYATRELAHDHAAEQPFTRSIQSVEIPEEVAVVTIEGRDQTNGWGGSVFELTLDRS
ncbi:MAG: hypothetical protein DRJ50_00020 [Actinobacteria bacterium]|nr:MAG: hypothetical protein DRJ50_00020 [Actinomycetota bacterium]